MCLRWGLPLVLAIVVLTLRPAEAQFGGMPGMPGSPGIGAPPQQQGPPPACQELLALRDETQKHGQALAAVGNNKKKKPTPDVVCKLFKAFLAAETKMIKGIERLGAQCGVPSDVPKQLKAQHVKAEATAKNICEAAAQGPRPAGPSLSDALGTTPMIPDSSNSKRGMGTFDTLSGSPLAR